MTAKNHSTSDSPKLQDTTLSHRPTLGEQCLIKGIARKRHTWDHGKWITEWVTDPFADKPFRAMYIGWRVVRRGEMDSDGALWEVGFQITRSYYVWLFVKDERSAPFYVFCRDVERIVGAK
jgi:hypothetical protein